ncbi:MAG: glycine/betaine ABC transporter substrate-binding protein [Ktedonobacterales bacterium]|nr:glycine/betaine ABC transporter substrate-binding protein [Ktedonobacterales bacterium]
MTQPRRFSRGLLAFGFLAILAGVVLAGCGASSTGGAGAGVNVTVGSKNDPDGQLLAEMYSLLLKAQGYNVTTKLMLGQTPVLDAAIKSGTIDIYPEFTGTGIGVYKLPSTQNPQQAYSEVKTYYEQNFQITWLAPAYGLNDSYGLCTSQAKAQQLNLKSIDDLVAQASNLTLSGQQDFTDAQKGVFPPVQQAYNLQFKKVVNVSESLGFAAVTSGQVDINECYTTDPAIVTNNFVLLTDTKGAFPIYNPAPIVRDALLTKSPAVKTTLETLETHLTTEKITQLIKQVSIDKKSVPSVAEAFLKSEKLLS